MLLKVNEKLLFSLPTICRWEKDGQKKLSVQIHSTSEILSSPILIYQKWAIMLRNKDVHNSIKILSSHVQKSNTKHEICVKCFKNYKFYTTVISYYLLLLIHKINKYYIHPRANHNLVYMYSERQIS